jgi:predicted PurR-regulated permease PerM
LRRLLHQQLYVGVLLAAIIWFVFSVREILPIFLFAFILAYLLGPLVRRVAGPEGKGISRSAAALLVYLIVIAILAAAFYALYQALRTEILSYAKNYHQYRDALLVRLQGEEANGLLRALPDSAKVAINNLVRNSDDTLASLARGTLPALVRTAPRLLELVAVPILAYYFLTDYGRFFNYVRRVIRPEGRARFDQLIREIDASLRGYLAGQATLSLVMGVAAFLILSLNGVRPALVVGIAAAFLELIPVVGPLLWALVALVLTYVQQPSHIVVVAVLLLITHQADMHILAPRILGGHLRLHPAVVIFALLAGNTLMGILGVLLAAPLAATINTILTYLITEGALSPAAVFRKEAAPATGAAPAPPQPANGSGASTAAARRGRSPRRRTS